MGDSPNESLNRAVNVADLAAATAPWDAILQTLKALPQREDATKKKAGGRGIGDTMGDLHQEASRGSASAAAAPAPVGTGAAGGV